MSNPIEDLFIKFYHKMPCKLTIAQAYMFYYLNSFACQGKVIKFTDNHLAKRFSYTPGAVRKIISQLTKLGLIERKSRSGFTVLKIIKDGSFTCVSFSLITKSKNSRAFVLSYYRELRKNGLNTCRKTAGIIANILQSDPCPIRKIIKELEKEGLWIKNKTENMDHKTDNMDHKTENTDHTHLIYIQPIINSYKDNNCIKDQRSNLDVDRIFNNKNEDEEMNDFNNGDYPTNQFWSEQKALRDLLANEFQQKSITIAQANQVLSGHCQFPNLTHKESILFSIRSFKNHLKTNQIDNPIGYFIQTINNTGFFGDQNRYTIDPNPQKANNRVSTTYQPTMAHKSYEEARKESIRKSIGIAPITTKSVLEAAKSGVYGKYIDTTNMFKKAEK